MTNQNICKTAAAVYQVESKLAFELHEIIKMSSKIETLPQEESTSEPLLLVRT